MEEIDKKNMELLVVNSQNKLINTLLKEEAEIATLKKQEMEISNARKFREKRLEDYKQLLKNVLEENGIEKIQTETGTIFIRLNPISVVVDDIDKVPSEFVIEKTMKSVDKKKVADYFKETGEIIDGLTIQTNNTSLQIK